MDKTIENRFFDIFRQGGIASMCVDVLREKYDLGLSKRENPLLDEWQEFYFNELPQKIKEAEGVLKFDYDALFSEIESNIEEIENNPKKLDNYCTTLLTPFADFLRSVRPVKHRKKEWQKRMEDAELLLKSNNDEDRDFAEELKLLAKEEEERQKEIEIGYWEITQMAAKCPPTENFDAYLAAHPVEVAFGNIMDFLDDYSIRLDWVLAQNGIDLMKLQERYAIYLLNGRNLLDYIHLAGTKEIAQSMFDNLAVANPKRPQPKGKRIAPLASFFNDASNMDEYIKEAPKDGNESDLADYFDCLVRKKILNDIPTRGTLNKEGIIVSDNWKGLCSYRRHKR